MSSARRSSVCRAVAASAVVLACAACSTATTTIAQEWRDPSYAAGPMTSLLVVAARVTPLQRRALEDGFASALTMHGIRATPSYTLFPGDLPDPAQAKAAVQKEGFDGVLVSVLRSLDEKTFLDVRTGSGGGFFDGYWGPGWAEPPPRPRTDENVRFETTLWDPHGRGKLVWSAATETVSPASGHGFVSSLVNRIEPALMDADLIPPVSAPRVSSAANLRIHEGG
jgi:hypothetical protein